VLFNDEKHVERHIFKMVADEYLTGNYDDYLEE